jgi:EpsI family protein
VTQWGGADVQLLRRYQGPDGRLLDVYVGYFEAQRQDKELGGSRSADLHRQASQLLIPLSNGATLPVNLVRPGRNRKASAVFWYDIDGRLETGLYAAKFWTLWHAITRRRTNGTVVLVSALPASGGSEAQSVADVQDFAPRLYGALAGLLSGGL